jgi:hypothetical protein
MFNNRATFTPENCESDACNGHVGQVRGGPGGEGLGAPCDF